MRHAEVRRFIAMKAGTPPRLGTDELRRLLEAHEALVERQRPATLRVLIESWRPSSPEWKALGDSTKKTWGSALDAIDDKWGETPISVWNDPRMTRKVIEWRDSRADRPRAADMGVQVLRSLLKFARLRGKVAINVAEGVPQLYRAGARAEIIWSQAELDKFASAAIELGRVHVLDGVRLASLTGLRREDLITLSWNEVTEHAIVKRAAKKSRGKRWTVTVPRLADLSELLGELKDRPRAAGVNSVLVTSRGTQWTGDAFTHAFSQVRDHVGISHVDDDGVRRKKHIHDLRGTFCTKLIAAGLSDQDVAEVMGRSPDQVRGIRRHYVDQNAIVRAIGDRMQSKMDGAA